MSPTQEQRSAATRSALIAAARRLWTERGYAEVGTPEIATAAGVTRGAMYHQFADKASLFVAVLETVEEEIMARLAAIAVTAEPTSPAAALRIGTHSWLDIATEPEARQLVLLDATSVLGWAGFRDVSLRYGLGMTEALLQAAMDAGELRRQPARALAHVVLAATDEAAMVVAQSDDPASAREEMRAVIDGLLDGLAAAGQR